MDQAKLERYKKAQTLRSKETHAQYVQFLEDKMAGRIPEKCIFCEKELLLKEFHYWMVLDNRFPYDRLYQTSHMLAPKRHVATEMELRVGEMSELLNIKEKHLRDYHLIIENIGDRVSIKNHFHLHILF